ncbi:arf-GAP with SH3 domain, ANK repeat and PH domain-containing protein 1-like isoform X1 [Callospermophilus lateralis]|uniref:arf-GAP with SH3 domain, ANK repeat and PH domain-containing protein 1-like isoform X1 n=1 Tax=Callospermophilus lateralis TaxID=76772 RepID=UPI004038F93E
MHQLQGNKEYGSEKKGYQLKKSDGIRKVWQRRKCTVKNGILTISHATSNRQPAKLNLLTCQVKPNAEDKKSFDLISHESFRTLLIIGHIIFRQKMSRIMWRGYQC